MNIDYLYSIVRLYLKNEDDNKKTALRIRKLDDQIEFNFDMKEKNFEPTTFVIPHDLYKSNLEGFINLYKQNLMIIDEKYSSNKVNNTCYYYVLFKNGRSISFNGFSILEMNDIRNILYDIKINKEEIRIDSLDEKKEMLYNPRLRLQQAGFSSFVTLFLTVLFLTDIFVISLWVFKLLMK